MARHASRRVDAVPAGRRAPTRAAGGSPGGSTPEFVRRRLGQGEAQSAQDPGHRVAAREQATSAGRRANDAGGPLRRLGIVLGLIAITGMLAVIAFVIVSNTSAFTIGRIEADATEHLAAEDIGHLAGVPEGTTLLTVNEDEVRENLHKNPWVADVEITRVFPDVLHLSVTERRIEELVVLGSGGVVWCLGTGGVWIEPIEVNDAGQGVASAALAVARELGALLVSDVPVSVNPKAGAEATDEELLAVQMFREQFSPSFLARVVQMSAPGPESISCMLDSGVEISLGAPVAIASKETKIEWLLAKYPNQLTYINVRVPSHEAVRLVNDDSVQSGTGVLGMSDEAGRDAAESQDVTDDAQEGTT